jgi:hypothetical protein
VDSLDAILQVLRCQPLVGSVNGAGSMSDKFHGFADWNVATSHARDDGDARGMKAAASEQLPQPDAVEIAVPVAARPLAAGPGGRRPGGDRARLAQLLEERNQVGVQEGGEFAAAFGAKADGVAFRAEGDVGLGIQPGLGEAAALVQGDFKAVPEHRLHGGVWRCVEVSADESDGLLGQLGLAASDLLLDAEFEAGVCRAEPANDRLAHDEPQELQLEQGGVVAGAVFAVGLVRLFAPVEVIEAMLAGEAGGARDFILGEEQGDGTPRGLIALAGEAFIDEARTEEGPNPIPALGGGARGLELVDRVLGGDRSGAADIGRSVGAAFGGDLADLAGFVPELDPKEWGAISFIQIRHSAVCTLVYRGRQKPANTREYWRILANDGKAKVGSGVRIPLSPPAHLQVFNGQRSAVSVLVLAPFAQTSQRIDYPWVKHLQKSE